MALAAGAADVAMLDDGVDDPMPWANRRMGGFVARRARGIAAGIGVEVGTGARARERARGVAAGIGVKVR